jgi:hypothetical protein
MAIARLVCGDCGGLLGPSDSFCSHCGARIEAEATGPRQSSGGLHGRKEGPQVCDVCGVENTRPGAYCESCGARLVSSSAAGTKPPRPDDKGGQKSRKVMGRPKDAGKSTGRKWQPWQIAAGVAILVALSYFAYTELDSQPSPSRQQIPAAMPFVQPAAIDEIGRLQKIVDASPGDASSALRLANLLHDAGMSDPAYLNRAVEMYKKYLVQNPKNPDARVDLGICYYELGRKDTARSEQFYAMALKEMKTAYDQNPGHQTAAFNLGIVNLQAGNMNEASEWFQRTVALDGASKLGTLAKQLLEQHAAVATPN